MARGRFISSTLGRSKKFNALPDHFTKLLYVHTLTTADEQGRIEADPTDIFADHFVLDVEASFERIEQGLQALHEVGLITLYDIDGKRYAEFASFSEHNRIRRNKNGDPVREGRSRIPPPPRRNATTAQELRSDRAVAAQSQSTTAAATAQELRPKCKELSAKSKEQRAKSKETPSSSGDDTAPEKSKKRSAQNGRAQIIDELAALWNENRGKLAEARVVSREIESKIRMLVNRHGEEGLREMFLPALKVVREDDHWLGRKAKNPRRDGAPYGLINFLRHIEDKANQAFEEGAAADIGFTDVVQGDTWYSDLGIVRIDAVVEDESGQQRAMATVLKRYRDDHPQVGETWHLKREQLRRRRNT